MSFRLVLKSVTLNDLERRNSQPPRNFTEFGSFRGGHDMEVFVYVSLLRLNQCQQKYYNVRSYDGDVCVFTAKRSNRMLLIRCLLA